MRLGGVLQMGVGWGVGLAGKNSRIESLEAGDCLTDERSFGPKRVNEGFLPLRNTSPVTP